MLTLNMNYSNLTPMYESIFAQMYVLLVLFTIFLLFTMDFFKPKLQKFYQKYVYLGENTLIHCSQRTIVHVYVNAFL